MELTRETFTADATGRRFADVVARVEFDAWLGFFDDHDRRRRMCEAELHHDRPAIAGVIVELERRPEFADALADDKPARALRVRQAIGVLVKLVMADLGWGPTRTKGAIGRRGEATAGGINSPGSLSRWFTKAERYAPQSGNDDAEST